MQCFVNFSCPFAANGQPQPMHSSGNGCVLGNGVARASKSLRSLASVRQNSREAELGQPTEEWQLLLPGEGCQFRQTLKGFCQRTTIPIDDRRQTQCNGQCIWIVSLSC